MDVLPPGTNVIVGEEVRGTVAAVTVRHNFHVTYEIVWWSGPQRVVQQVEAAEVRPDVPLKTLRMGFATPSRED